MEVEGLKCEFQCVAVVRVGSEAEKRLEQKGRDALSISIGYSSELRF